MIEATVKEYSQGGWFPAISVDGDIIWAATVVYPNQYAAKKEAALKLKRVLGKLLWEDD